MTIPSEQLRTLLGILDKIGAWIAPLGLRLVLAREFWLAGVAKLSADNRFAGLQDRFPFPFDLLPVDLSWQLVTWLELIAPIALVLGLGTRLSALSLALLTLLSMAVFHAGLDPVGWRLALLHLALCLALTLSGPGKLSLDHWLRGRYLKAERRLWS